MKRVRRFQLELEVEFEEPEEAGGDQGDCSLKDVDNALSYSSAQEALSVALDGSARLYVQGQYSYTLNGKPVDLDLFLAENEFDDDEKGEEGPVGQTRDELTCLRPGRSYRGGGGAAPEWEIACSLELP